MQQTLLIASRKGLFVLQGHGSQWRIAAHHFAGDPVTQVMTDPRTGDWYAALRLGHFGAKLRKSSDQGATWLDIATPAFPAKPTDGPLAADTVPWNVELIWSLTPGGPHQPGTLWAGCMPAGLFKSEDGGHTWALNRPLWDNPRRMEWMGGGNDYPGMHSVLVDPRDANHLRVAISCGGVWQSADAGQSWTLTADGMKADYLPPDIEQDPNGQDPHRMVQCAAAPDVLWVQHHCGIYRSSDGGRNWNPIAPPQPSGFGFAVACDPHNPQRAWFAPAHSDALRFPVTEKWWSRAPMTAARALSCWIRGCPPKTPTTWSIGTAWNWPRMRKRWRCLPPRVACGSARMRATPGTASPATCHPWPRWAGWQGAELLPTQAFSRFLSRF